MSEALLTVTEAAIQRIRSVEESENIPDPAVRVTVREMGVKYRYEFDFVKADEKTPEDTAVEVDGIIFYIDPESVPHLRGATLEYTDDATGQGFRFDNPNQPALLANPIAARVQQILDERINPGVASHGGSVSLIDVQDGRVFVQLGGGCQGCGMADVTLKQGIEAMLKEGVPEVTEVLDTTDHAAGSNPYYQPGK